MTKLTPVWFLYLISAASTVIAFTGTTPPTARAFQRRESTLQMALQDKPVPFRLTRRATMGRLAAIAVCAASAPWLAPPPAAADTNLIAENSNVVAVEVGQQHHHRPRHRHRHDAVGQGQALATVQQTSRAERRKARVQQEEWHAAEIMSFEACCIMTLLGSITES